MDISKYSPIQFKLASLLAYYTLHLHNEVEAKKEAAMSAMFAAEHACAVADIPGEDTFAIREGKFKGLQNMNKLSGVVLFESDYDFSGGVPQRKVA